MLLDPEGSVLIVSLAAPFTRLAEPSVVDPEVNVTEPVANAVVDLTMAVKVIALPTAAGLIEETSCRDVAAGVITSFSVADVPDAVAESPL